MTVPIQVRVANPDEREQAFKLRREVFIDEQNVPEDEEFDRHEDESLHLLAWAENQPAGTARLRFVDGWAKFERIAVAQAWRGHGVGAALMRALLEQSKGQACCLNAQCQALEFYRRWGFIPVGPVFLDAGIPHRRMENRPQAPDPGAQAEILIARPEDAQALAALALAAKRHWGYPESWLANWSPELRPSPSHFASGQIWKAVSGEGIIGWCAVEPGEAPAVAELSHCWVSPQAMGQGIGRHMLRHALAHLAGQGYVSLRILSDPHAEGFYTRLGAICIGSEPSRIPGRSLPLLELRL